MKDEQHWENRREFRNLIGQNPRFEDCRDGGRKFVRCHTAINDDWATGRTPKEALENALILARRKRGWGRVTVTLPKMTPYDRVRWRRWVSRAASRYRIKTYKPHRIRLVPGKGPNRVFVLFCANTIRFEHVTVNRFQWSAEGYDWRYTETGEFTRAVGSSYAYDKNNPEHKAIIRFIAEQDKIAKTGKPKLKGATP